MRFLAATAALIFVVLVLGGCDRETVEPLGFREAGTVYSVEGKWMENEIRCDIYCEKGTLRGICFYEPMQLEGVMITSLSGGGWNVKKGEISVEMPKNSLEGILEIGWALAEEPMTVDAVQYFQKEAQFTLRSGKSGETYVLTLDGEGEPVFFSGERFSCRISRVGEL